jgi:DNA-binding response OmpR family regulator
LRSDRVPVRILLLTARQREGDVLRGFALGADDYVVKPFSPMELVARLKRLAGR